MIQYRRMKSPEFIAHGTPSEQRAEKILDEGFIAQEGRATVSGDIIYAFEWATERERQKSSRGRDTEIAEGETGRIIILKIPEDTIVGYGTQTGVVVNEKEKKITGYPRKYVSGRRQLGIYIRGADEDGVNATKKQKAMEQAKEDLEILKIKIADFLRSENLDPRAADSLGYMRAAIKNFEPQRQAEILKKAEDFEKQKKILTKKARHIITLPKEQVLISIHPTEALGKKLAELSKEIRNLEKIDIARYTRELSEIIEENPENFLASGCNIPHTLARLIETTIETELVNGIRSLSKKLNKQKVLRFLTETALAKKMNPSIQMNCDTNLKPYRKKRLLKILIWEARS